MGRISSGLRRSGVSRWLGPPTKVLLGTVALLWLIELIDVLVPSWQLDRFGVRPRDLSGLLGIPLAPWLHVGFAHVAANTIPLFVLGMLIGIRGVRHLFQVSVIVVCLGGLGVWLIGQKNSVHLGASGVVFGYFGYLLTRGFFDRRAGSLIIGLIVLVLYGGIIWGVLPTSSAERVSWQGHLCGLVAGSLAAKWLTDKSPS